MRGALALADSASTASLVTLQSSESGLVKLTEDGLTADPIEDSTISAVSNVWRLGTQTIVHVERVAPENDGEDSVTPPTNNQVCQFLLLVDEDAFGTGGGRASSEGFP